MKIAQEVPESISLAKVAEFVASLGIDPTYLREFYCGIDGVSVEVIALNADGKPFLGANGDIAVHRIVIPLDRDA